MSDREKIEKLIEAYDSIERCYQAIEDLFKEQIDIETLSYAQVDIADVIGDIAKLNDADDEWIFLVLSCRESSISDRATRILCGENDAST